MKKKVKYINIKVDGIVRKTYLDEDEIQRFVSDCPVLRRMVDLNLVNLNLCNQLLTSEEFSELIRNMNYSVGGWLEMSCNKNKSVENPLWKEK